MRSRSTATSVRSTGVLLVSNQQRFDESSAARRDKSSAARPDSDVSLRSFFWVPLSTRLSADTGHPTTRCASLRRRRCRLSALGRDFVADSRRLTRRTVIDAWRTRTVLANQSNRREKTVANAMAGHFASTTIGGTPAPTAMVPNARNVTVAASAIMAVSGFVAWSARAPPPQPARNACAMPMTRMLQRKFPPSSFLRRHWPWPRFSQTPRLLPTASW